MKPIHHLTARLLLCLAALLTVTACQDDYIEKNAGLTGDSDKTTLRLIVPMTRTVPDKETDNGELTNNPDVSSEGYIRNLWLLAYPVGDKGDVLVQRLDPRITNLTHDYKPFDIEIKLGTYHMYVVANVDETFTSDTKEDELQDIILEYKNGENGITLPNPAAGLPMVCEYQDIKLTESGDRVGEAGVEIKFNETTTVYADLTFVCVKVRYTLVFDNSTNGVSKAFNESRTENPYINNVVRIDGIQAVKIPGEAPLLIHPVADADKERACLMEADGTTYSSIAVPAGTYYFNTTGTPTFDRDYSDYDGFIASTAAATGFNSNDASSYAYRGTLYLPEHYVTKATQASQTELHISATLLSQSKADGPYVERATLKYTIELGDTQEQDDQTNEADKVRQLPRGRYYDIIARITGVGEELEMTAAVCDWTPQTVAAELNGPYFLQVEKTEGVKVTAGQSTVVNCSTDAPILTCESPTYILNGKEIAIYKVKFQQNEAGEYTSFTVTVNPEMPAVENASSNAAIKKYIYIVANTIGANDELKEGLKKKINITPVLDPYLVVTPSNYTIYMKEVANQESYSVPFTYETNLKNIKITKDEAADHTHIDYSFAFEDEPQAYEWGTSVDFPEGIGTLTCKLKETHNQQNFPENEPITFTYEATGNVLQDGGTTTQTITKTTTLQIVPNATTYRLYFRPVSDDWVEPHIYVYEPLYTASDITGTYNGIVPDPNELVFVSDAGENALLYSYTGKLTFNGWSSHGGSVTFGSDNNVWRTADTKNLCWGALSVEEGSTNSNYNHTIDYSPDFRKGTVCSSCNDNNVKYKWPGVGMKKSDTYEGWYYYDLPLLAEPGKVLIMFADGHDGKANTKKDENIYWRYPGHMIPGIPLYNFADKEGWFYYNPILENQNEFVDDRPLNNPGPELKDIYTYKIWIDYYINSTNVHLWTKINDNQTDPHNTWPGEQIQYDNGRGYVTFQRAKEYIGNKVGFNATKSSVTISGDQYIQHSAWNYYEENGQGYFEVSDTVVKKEQTLRYRIYITKATETANPDKISYIYVWDKSPENVYKDYPGLPVTIVNGDEKGGRYIDILRPVTNMNLDLGVIINGGNGDDYKLWEKTISPDKWRGGTSGDIYNFYALDTDAN